MSEVVISEIKPIREFGLSTVGLMCSHVTCLKSEVTNFLCKEHSRLEGIWSLPQLFLLCYYNAKTGIDSCTPIKLYLWT